MNKIKLKEIIDSSDNNPDNLYNKFTIIDKEQTKFDSYYLVELFYTVMYLFHKKYGIEKLSVNGSIPKLDISDESYETFKKDLEKYKSIEYHNEVLQSIGQDVTNMFQWIEFLVWNNLFIIDDPWLGIYSSEIYNNNVESDGKIYISVDNKDLLQFAYHLLLQCLEEGLNDFEFKIDLNETVNRTDNLVIHFTYNNLNKYLEIIEKIKKEHPEFLINQSNILGEEISKGVVIGKDFVEGEKSFTSQICKDIINLKKRGISSEEIVEIICDDVTKRLEPIISQLDISDINLPKNEVLK